ncbi:MAG: alanine--tRNA ligase [bacterium]
MMMTANEIRQRFLNFFAEREHRIVPSAPVVPHGDATLMFTNAGMNQFKDVFLGTGSRDYTRCADTQKCIRVSGKHNDLEEVGVDTYHHTFFEMLGNWSFGDYFKREAIRWAFEFLVDEMGLDPDRLYATVFGGDEALGLGADEEAEALWPVVSGIPAERVLRFGRKDNFWEMAVTGPCGPCSEIHLDLGEAGCDRQGVEGHSCRVNGDCGRFIEIWNLVFIQYNHLEDGTLEKLPAKHVDTGMGFERLVSVCQGRRSNYDTDLFTPLFAELEQLTGVAYGAGERTDVALRVVADHVRTLSVAIADNVVPSNKDRGYVLRRLLRRASRYGFQVLGQREPFVHRLVDAVAAVFSDVFPEIGGRGAHIRRVIEQEERAFLRTLERGVGLFSAVVDELEGDARRLDGEVAFKLYETYGFPRDLTELMARERGITVDWAGWDRAERTHAEASKGEERQALDPRELEGLRPTRFLGYWELGVAGELGLDATSKLLKLVDNEYVVLDQTPFYAEAGGQVGDTGVIEAPGFRFVVWSTHRVGELIVHRGDLEEADLAALPEEVTARVDGARRRDIMANHTATHLLHWALREVVSEEAHQKGSLVHPEYLRFDFTLDRAVTEEQLAELEQRVNERIAENREVSIAERSYQEAVEAGVTALFGEKYGDRVRVVTVGDYSAELCGGTHCRSTGEIGLFQILSERASSAGVRRIVAETRTRSLERVRELRQTTQGLERLLGVPRDQLPARVEKLLEENKRLRKGGAAKADIGSLRRELLQGADRVGDVYLVFAQVEQVNAKQAADLADALRGGDEQVVGVLAAAGDKPALVAFATRSLTDSGRANATELVRLVGKGGGRPDFAKGSCAAGAELEAGLAAARRTARAKLD